MFRILAISGSLRATSSNTALLRALPRVVPTGVEVDLYDGLGTLPHFNPDIEEGGTLPPAVADLRARVLQADAIVISAPEYAHGVPGVLKNALDWLVGGVEMPGKKVAFFNASPRATRARASLGETLATMSGVVVTPACITVPLLGREMDEAAIAADPELSRVIREAIVALTETGRD